MVTVNDVMCTEWWAHNDDEADHHHLMGSNGAQKPRAEYQEHKPYVHVRLICIIMQLSESNRLLVAQAITIWSALLPPSWSIAVSLWVASLVPGNAYHRSFHQSRRKRSRVAADGNVVNLKVDSHWLGVYFFSSSLLLQEIRYQWLHSVFTCSSLIIRFDLVVVSLKDGCTSSCTPGLCLFC